MLIDGIGSVKAGLKDLREVSAPGPEPDGGVAPGPPR